MHPNTQGVTIIVEDTEKQFHSIKDWKLGIENNDYIGTPELETNYIQVPGANKLLDVSQALTGRRTYKSRPILVKFGAVNREINWDSIISTFRNQIDGRNVRLIFDNDETHYWIGRCQITNFDRARTLGKFNLSIPYADAYKYNVRTNVEPWIWDTFNFNTDSIPTKPIIDVDGTKTIVIPAGNMYTVPTFTVTSKDSNLTVSLGNRTYEITYGVNYIPTLMVNGDLETTLTFKGKGTVVMEYRGGSL